MATYGNSSQADQAAAYERYIRENWDSLAPFEQEQARSWLQARAMAAMQPGYGTNPYGGQSATGSPQSGYGYGGNPYGYGSDPFGGSMPRKPENTANSWAVPVGYVGLFLFLPLALVCGVVNLVSGRTGHGIAQLGIPAVLFLLLVVTMMSY